MLQKCSHLQSIQLLVYTPNRGDKRRCERVIRVAQEHAALPHAWQYKETVNVRQPYCIRRRHRSTLTCHVPLSPMSRSLMSRSYLLLWTMTLEEDAMIGFATFVYGRPIYGYHLSGSHCSHEEKDGSKKYVNPNSHFFGY